MFAASTRRDISKALDCLRWMPSYAVQCLTKPAPPDSPIHVVLAVADHFEPGFRDLPTQRRRIQRWCHDFQKVVADFPDSDGRTFRHTFFYPAEQYNPLVMEPLLQHCRDSWGEIEIQLHHGVDHPDTSANTRSVLEHFRDTLAGHGCLSRTVDDDLPRYAFVHGNWALANSYGNRYCGVDDELQILAETGCYADMTLPSAPDGPQTSKINAIYECSLPLERKAAHRRGRDLKCGVVPERLPVIIQGPLAIYLDRRRGRLRVPRIENSEISRANPPTLSRFARWLKAGISVAGRPEWVFVKLHCHGLDEGEDSAMFGKVLARFLDELVDFYHDKPQSEVHFVSAREMFNIAYAACDGRDGNPRLYRDYKLTPVGTTRQLAVGS